MKISYIHPNYWNDENWQIFDGCSVEYFFIKVSGTRFVIHPQSRRYIKLVKPAVELLDEFVKFLQIGTSESYFFALALKKVLQNYYPLAMLNQIEQEALEYLNTAELIN